MPSESGTITFVNLSEFEAGIYVQDENGDEAHVVDLMPGQSSEQETVEDEVWIIKDKELDQQVGTAYGTSGQQTHEIKFRRGRSGPEASGSGGGN